jgi:hypothetical protein
MNQPSNTIPVKACVFASTDSTVAADEKKEGFSIVGYSGKPILNHWYWGNLAFDLNGVKFAKAKTPVLEEHTTNRRLGVAAKQEVDKEKGVLFSGGWLNNEWAAAVKADMDEGFPMEASLYIVPERYEFIEDGAQAEVNGYMLAGPGAIFRESMVKEVSICVFGADSATLAESFRGKGENIQCEFTIKEREMSDKKEEVILTSEILRASNSEIYEEVFAAGVAAEKARFSELSKLLEGDAELLAACFAEGVSVAEADKRKTAKLIAKLQADNEELRKAKPVDPAVAAFKDDTQQTVKKIGEMNDAELEAHFNADPKLAAEYHTFAGYKALVKRGEVK